MKKKASIHPQLDLGERFSEVDSGDRLVLPGRVEMEVLHLMGYLDGRVWMEVEKRPSAPVGPVLRFCVEITKPSGETWRDHLFARPNDAIPEDFKVVRS